MSTELLSVITLAALSLVGLLLVILLLKFRGLSELSQSGLDLTPILASLSSIEKSLEKTDRSLRDEISRNRQEQTGQAQALRTDISTTLEGLTRSNDQRLELVRSAMEKRLDSFTAESGHKIDGLTQSVGASSVRLQDEVSIKLAEFRHALEETRKQAHQLQREQSDTIATTLTSLQGSLDERQFRLQTVVEAKLTDVEAALRSQAQQLRLETGEAFKTLGESMLVTLTAMAQGQKGELQDLKTTVEGRLTVIQVENEKKLEQMRQTVDEKLQGTLEARLGESFKQVSDRLEQVHKGLGEMQTLAAGVGDLKKVLSNVKTRGNWGEVQLGALLEQMLAPEQYGHNIATSGTLERVEYAVKFPGPENHGEPVWLPIDAKFPVEDYLRLVEASERADSEGVEKASRQLETTLKTCAKAIHDKYVAPPSTTDFGILFLATEGLYAEAMRRPGLADFVQREHRVILSGPSTLAALLNSFQMGFHTLAIQKRSSEVWSLLGTVKAEFVKYADVLAKVKKKLEDATSTIDKAETRTRVIERKLRDVQTTDSSVLIAAEVLGADEAEDAQLLIGAGR